VIDILVLANFVEVFLAKEGHSGIVGINLLEKIQLPTLPSIFGAMLAGVDYVLMGAGIPRAIPAVLDRLAAYEPTELPLNVSGSKSGEGAIAKFDPGEYCGSYRLPLARPKFVAIIASTALAISLARKCTSKVAGFVIEGSTAGGHNAPPRGEVVLDERGQPVYGPNDIPDLKKISEIGLPFWLAGSYGDRERVEEALACGAAGVQVGTAFAFCEESGIAPEIKESVLSCCRDSSIGVFTDPQASPTGFPFKVVELPGSASDQGVYKNRARVCDLGYLREYYATAEGGVGYRCPAEPEEDYVRKGGDIGHTVGRKCVCNGLLATIGLAQVRKSGQTEAPLITAGDDIVQIAKYLKPGAQSYTALDVLDRLLGR
jgi:NAD(P)H-dependent flavin oxidoreductase YrpB (nitropropane dioxygenase family)